MKNIRINGYKVIDRSNESYKPDSFLLMESISASLKEVDGGFDKIKTIESISTAYELAKDGKRIDREIRSMESDLKLIGTGKMGIVAGVVGIALGIVAVITIFKNLKKLIGILKRIMEKLWGWIKSLIPKFSHAVNKDGKDEHTAKAVIQNMIPKLTGENSNYKKLDYLWLTESSKSTDLFNFIMQLEGGVTRTETIIQDLIREIEHVIRKWEDHDIQNVNDEFKKSTTGTGKNKQQNVTWNGATFASLSTPPFSKERELNSLCDDLNDITEFYTNLKEQDDIKGNMTEKQAYEYLNKVYHDMSVGTMLSQRCKQTLEYLQICDAKFNTILNALDRYQEHEDLLRRGRGVAIIESWNKLTTSARCAFTSGLSITSDFEKCVTNVTKTYNIIISEIKSAKELNKFENITSKKM